MHLNNKLLPLLCISFFVAYYPVWRNLVNVWANNANYSHGFVILPLSLYILWRQRSELANAAKATTGQRKGLLFATFALIIYILALVGGIQTLSSLSMIFFLAGVILYLWGYQILRITTFPLILLVLMIPVPSQLLAAMTIPLQLLVTEIAGALAGSIGIPIYIQGNLIHLPNQIFEVVEACSGLRSIMTLITLGAFMGYFTLNTNWQRILLVASALPIAIVVNSGRVLAMVVFSFYFNIDLLQGKSHTFFGMGIFLVSLLFFFGIQKILAQWQTIQQSFGQS
jgi:exosortase